MELPTSKLHDNRRQRIEYVSLDAVRSNARDPRHYSIAVVRRIAKAVQVFGVMPQIVTADRMILSGNIWLEAAKLAGITFIPIVVIDYLTPSEEEALMVFLVRAVELGEWDVGKLGDILRDLSLEVELTGFEVSEIDLYVGNRERPAEGPDPADKPAPIGPSVSRIGDSWRLRDHHILCGNALDPEGYSSLLMGCVAAMIITDPPYNVPIAGNVSGLGATKHSDFLMGSGELTEAEYTDMLIKVCLLLATHSLPGSLHYIFTDWRHQFELLRAGRAAYADLKNVCVWVKSNAGMGSFYRSQHEFVYVFKNGTAAHRNNVQLGRFDRNRTNVWTYPSINNFGRGGEEGNLLALHPTVKPVALVADAILDASAPDEIVLDSFLGSGTTIIAAERTRRRCYGFELDPKYVDVAVRRWQAFTGEAATLAGTDLTFDAVALERSRHE